MGRRMLGCFMMIALAAMVSFSLAQPLDEADDPMTEEELVEGDSGDEEEGEDSHLLTEAAAPVPAVGAAGDAGAAVVETAGAGQAAPVGGQGAEAAKEESRYEPVPLFGMPEFEISAGTHTFGGDTWTRFLLGIDIPIWRFGVFLDFELFFDPKFKVSDKGWNFKDEPADAFFRKIRYIRYGQEDDPLFVKFGALQSASLGYGVVMRGFSNMLHYPEYKLMGLQVNVNDVSPLGVSMQAVVSDFDELFDDGGVVGARLAVRPLKMTAIPFIDGFFLGATYATDINTHAAARKWPDIYDADSNIINDRDSLLSAPSSSFSVYGFDAGIPIINWELLNLTLYTQFATRADNVKGWALGVPGFAVNVWKLWGNLEYRFVEGRYAPGFFDRYYLDERYLRDYVNINGGMEKGEYIDKLSLSGIYGRAGMDVWDILKLEAAYSYMSVRDTNHVIHSYEGTLGLGETVLTFIPKITLAEVYARNSNIGSSFNFKFKKGLPTDKLAGHFDPTPYFYWGGRVGFEIYTGLSLVLDYSHGWKMEDEFGIGDWKLKTDNQIFIHTALGF